MKFLILCGLFLMSFQAFSQQITEKESKEIANYFENICGDVWCEGDYIYHSFFTDCHSKEGICQLGAYLAYPYAEIRATKAYVSYLQEKGKSLEKQFRSKDYRDNDEITQGHLVLNNFKLIQEDPNDPNSEIYASYTLTCYAEGYNTITDLGDDTVDNPYNDFSYCLDLGQDFFEKSMKGWARSLNGRYRDITYRKNIDHMIKFMNKFKYQHVSSFSFRYYGSLYQYQAKLMECIYKKRSEVVADFKNLAQSFIDNYEGGDPEKEFDFDFNKAMEEFEIFLLLDQYGFLVCQRSEDNKQFYWATASDHGGFSWEMTTEN